MQNQTLDTNQLSDLYDYLREIKSIEIERTKKGLEEQEVLVLDHVMSNIIDSFYRQIVVKIGNEKNISTRSDYLKSLSTIFRSDS